MGNGKTDQQSELRRSEAQARLAALDEGRSRYEKLFDTIDDGFSVVECTVDENDEVIDWTWLEVNRAFEVLSTLKDVVGRRASELLPGFADNAASLGRAIATGKTIRSDGDYSPGIDRWFRAHFARVGGDGSRIVAVRFEDITDRKRAEIALRESEERQAFLLKLSDMLRPVTDPLAIQDIAARTLGEHLDADRTYYAVVQGDYEFAVVEREYLRGDAPSVVGTHPFSTYGTAFDAFRNGRTMAVDDVEAADAIRREDLLGFRALSIRSLVNTPLVKGGRSVAGMTVLKATPHEWTAEQISLVEEVAERTWAAVERARAEAALRASEERFAQFAGASSGGIWIRDAGTLVMEYTSPAIGAIYGAEPSEVGGGIEKWAAMIVPDDRSVALEHIARARHGEAIVHEFRIQRSSDRTFRWIRDTSFPLEVNGRVQRIGGIAEDVTEAKLAIEHTSVLLAELQHRVRNIMAIIRAIASRSAERAGSVPEYAEILAGRLLAFSRVQALLTRAANVSVGLRTLVVDEISVQAQHEGQYDVRGPDIEISPKAAEVLTLAFHELSTNALKYGALSVPNGKVDVRWEIVEKRGARWLSLDWTEHGAPGRPASRSDEPRRVGFGSELIEGRIPYELNGRGRLVITLEGAQCHFEFPLKEGASVLETGAPRRATVFGGVLDMTGEPDLWGGRVLVVEDDYYQATDAARALRSAGAEVLGPCGNEAATREELAEQRPDAVLLDINLGDGATFKIAEMLKDQGIPFVFVTGYDQIAIPAEFEGITRLEKPVLPRQIVSAAAKLLSGSV